MPLKLLNYHRNLNIALALFFYFASNFKSNANLILHTDVNSPISYVGHKSIIDDLGGSLRDFIILNDVKYYNGAEYFSGFDFNNEFISQVTTGKYFFDGFLDYSYLNNTFFEAGGEIRDNPIWFNGKISNIKIATTESTGERLDEIFGEEIESISGSTPSSVDPLIYFENGTCKCPDASVGVSETIDGIVYTVVDDTSIASEITSGNNGAGNWYLCTTLVTNMNDLFSLNSTFNEDISFWDTSNVTTMNNLFKYAGNFNQDIGSWDTSNVTSFSATFMGANAFDQNIGNWDTSSATNMYSMLRDTGNFNQDISGWNTSNVTNMGSMLSGASQFNQDLSGWCVPNTTYTDFNTNGIIDNNFIPVWGSCPNVSTITCQLSLEQEIHDYTLIAGEQAYNGIIYGLPDQCFIDQGIADQINIISSDNIPNGLTLEYTDGTFDYKLVGTPANGTAGSYPIMITLFYEDQTLTDSFTLTIENTGQATNTASSTDCAIEVEDLEPGLQISIISPSDPNVSFAFSTTCTGTLNVTANGLPDGVQMTFEDNIVTIFGTPTDVSTNVFDYSLYASSGGTVSLTIDGRLIFSSDSDEDGVEDEFDQCPDTALGDEVDQDGCSQVQKDSDTTSSADCAIEVEDLEPGLQISIISPSDPNVSFAFSTTCTGTLNVTANGLPDGVQMTFEDNIVTIFGTPTDVSTNVFDYSLYASSGGTVSLTIDGRLIFSSDSDEDGVEDEFDQCPDTALGDEVDQDGCSQVQKDSDLDGVLNGDDICPNTSPDETANAKGCGETQLDDTDEDGIPDVKDNCPETPNSDQKDSDNDGEGDVCDPDPIVELNFSPIKEDAEIGITTGKVTITSTTGEEITSTEFDSGGFFILDNNLDIKLASELDYEEITSHPFTLTVKTANGGQTIVEGEIPVVDVPNNEYAAPFFVSIFELGEGTLPLSGEEFERYYNPFNRSVGKWKIRKSISGGSDAHLFAVKSEPPKTRKTDEENEGYLSFINPPDFNDPQDHNKDNIYEVEVTFINLEDGAIEVPVPVTQFQLQVPEGTTSALELQSRPALPDDDFDSDGVPDIIDNSPVVFNPNQADEDGDGVGDVSDDADHDGVWNPQDKCPDTPLGVRVDTFGCEIFYLPSNNFNVYKKEKCVDNHSIGISFEDTSYSYTINISGAIDYFEVTDKKEWIISNLSSGQYSICIGADGISSDEFERCFEVQLIDPLPLSVYSNESNFTASVDGSSDSVQLEMAGGSVYNIELNGLTTQTSRSSYSLTLRKGLNTVSVSTDQECQGVFEKEYFNSESIAYTPNPFGDELSIYVGGQDENVLVEMFTTSGKLIRSDYYLLNAANRNISVNTSGFKMGGYLFKVNGNTVKNSFIAIKK